MYSASVVRLSPLWLDALRTSWSNVSFRSFSPTEQAFLEDDPELLPEGGVPRAIGLE